MRNTWLQENNYFQWRAFHSPREFKQKALNLEKQGLQGKESHCSEISGPQTGGVVSLNLFQPLIETEGGGCCLHTSPSSGVLISAGSGFYLGFVLPLGGGRLGKQAGSRTIWAVVSYLPFSLYSPPTRPHLPCYHRMVVLSSPLSTKPWVRSFILDSRILPRLSRGLSSRETLDLLICFLKRVWV